MHFGFISFCFSLSTTLFAKVRHLFPSPDKLCWGLCVVLLCCCFGCQSSPSKEEDTAAQHVEQGNRQLTLNRAVTAYDHPDGQPVAALQKGDLIVLTDEISPRLYSRTTRKDTLLEPFFRVVLPNKELAWIYANPADFVLPTKDTLQWQWQNRLRGIFTPSELNLYTQIWDQWSNTHQAGLQLLTLQTIRSLRDQLEADLKNYPLLPTAQYEGLFPATLAYQNTAGPGWWIDFNQWVERCAKIPGADAELAIFQFYQKEVYPPDGIEYHFHSWEFPVTIQEKHSLLGRNIHFDLFMKLEQITQQYPFVQAECITLKNLLLDDITASGTSYWEDWPAIQSELDTILNTKNWHILNQEDLAILKQRRQNLTMPNLQELYMGKRNK